MFIVLLFGVMCGETKSRRPFRLTTHNQKMAAPSINISCLRHDTLRIQSSRFRVLTCLIFLCLLICANAGMAQRRVDDPDDQDDLNRELWEFARKTSYDSILPYIAAAQKESKAR